jgi:hypothetical protein
VLDELQIHQVPVHFGGGRRLIDVLPDRVELAVIRVIDSPAATHIRCRVVPWILLRRGGRMQQLECPIERRLKRSNGLHCLCEQQSPVQ